ncbi:BA14K family protein [Pseudaminobacter arsenicus]|uniref:Lectin-like protein BA14k n=1 Tax=Borborobacter arsenicus TaxID=1851146 RepID=A0A432V6V5_9HYPH|nr:BA14K family protein [Pseudaminobacter arsenicus]RUM97879.1 BA14K family protein [Pseudaminobacter arsenicus]
MKKFLSGLCATTLALSFTAASIAPANAAQPFVPKIESAQLDVTQVQYRDQFGQRFYPRNSRRDWREGRDFRRDARHYRRGFESRGDYYYWRGHRGYRHYRPGYREYNGFWFPAAAFIAGAIVSGALNNAQPVYRGGDSHVQWCYNRYRSYRASDNTYQPYNGPRRQCLSPY